MFKSSVSAVLVLVAGALNSVAHADQALANAKGCMACHHLDAKKVGPAFRDIAKKYRGKNGVSTTLTKKVLDGGSGNWGVVAMPANKTMGVTESDASRLVSWVLSLK